MWNGKEATEGQSAIRRNRQCVNFTSDYLKWILELTVTELPFWLHILTKWDILTFLWVYLSLLYLTFPIKEFFFPKEYFFKRTSWLMCGILFVFKRLTFAVKLYLKVILVLMVVLYFTVLVNNVQRCWKTLSTGKWKGKNSWLYQVCFIC